MKKVLFLAAIVLYQSSVFAQYVNKFWENAPESVKIMRLHTKINSTAKTSANKTTGIKQRLVGAANYVTTLSSYSFDDTDHYYYTGTHGFTVSAGVYNLDVMMAPYYVDGLYPRFDTHDQYYSNGQQTRYTQEFDSLDRVTSSLIEQYSGWWTNIEKYLAAYNSQGKPSNFKFYKWDQTTNLWRYIRYVSLTYDGQGRLLADTTYEDVGLGMNPTRLTNRIYTSFGYVSQELTKRWNGSWGDTIKYDFAYDANNNLVVNTMQKFENNSWQNVGKDSLGYSPSNVMLSEFTFGSSGSGWTSLNTELRHLNSADKPDTIKYYNVANNIVTLFSIDVYVYNSYGNISLITSSYPNSTINTFYLYYELYNDLSKIATENIKNLQLYPNPTNGTLNVQVVGSLHQHDATAFVYNSLGQQVIKTTAFTKAKDISIDVTSLKPGMYFIKLSDGESSYSERFTIR